MSDSNDRIQKMVSDNRVMLFMKGNRFFPQCGFSARAVSVLQHSGATFETFDVLSDPAIRQGIKSFSNWPTIPQLYIGGEFVGGSDIVMQMYQSGDLQKMLTPPAE